MGYSEEVVMTWHPPAKLLAEEAHFFIGITCVLGAVVLGFPWYDGAVAILVIDTIKEFTFDLKVEGDTIKNGLIDLSFYCLGIVVGFGVLHL